MRPPVWLVAIVVIVLAAAVLRVLGDTPPTTVDGLRVMTVSDVLTARAAGGLRNQPVAIGGYWSNSNVGAHMCPASLVPAGGLELNCETNEYGITQENEPMQLVSKFHEYVYQARGPHLQPYVDLDLPGLTRLFELRATNTLWAYPPTPVVLVGHFDDPRASDCQPEARQACLDRLVVDKVAFLNPRGATWRTDIPTPDPTDPPAPPVYQGG
ncbi:MAG: hypothetical protein QFC55_07320 [Chloroflexota bacterium]|nr:hypothetical protein [Chloroflexota bacterium]